MYSFIKSDLQGLRFKSEEKEPIEGWEVFVFARGAVMIHTMNTPNETRNDLSFSSPSPFFFYFPQTARRTPSCVLELKLDILRKSGFQMRGGWWWLYSFQHCT